MLGRQRRSARNQDRQTILLDWYKIREGSISQRRFARPRSPHHLAYHSRASHCSGNWPLQEIPSSRNRLVLVSSSPVFSSWTQDSTYFAGRMGEMAQASRSFSPKATLYPREFGTPSNWSCASRLYLSACIDSAISITSAPAEVRPREITAPREQRECENRIERLKKLIFRPELAHAASRALPRRLGTSHNSAETPREKMAKKIPKNPSTRS